MFHEITEFHDFLFLWCVENLRASSCLKAPVADVRTVGVVALAIVDSLISAPSSCRRCQDTSEVRNDLSILPSYAVLRYHSPEYSPHRRARSWRGRDLAVHHHVRPLNIAMAKPFDTRMSIREALT